MGYRPGRVLLPDGGDPWHIERRAKGFFGMRLTATGVSAHGSRPWEGENALHTLLDIARTLREEYPPKSPTDATLAFTAMRSGEAINQISDKATITLDFRTFDRQELTAFKARVIELASAQNTVVDILQQGSPVSFDDTMPEVQDFLKALRDITGQTIAYGDSFGGSDARYFASHNIPTIIIEPEGGGRHAPDEWLLATDLTKYYQLLERWLIPKK
jgi:succinyl-diaminopimelate desuccinylase